MTAFHLTISAPRRSAQRWGDWNYVHGLKAAMEAQGHCARFYCLHELQPGDVQSGDVVVRIAGPHLEDPIEGAVNIAWVISNPDPAFPRLLAGYQHIFAAGAPLAAWYAGQNLPASILMQATDLSRFQPVDAPPSQQILFVGGYQDQRVQRRLVLRTVALGYPIAIWGPGWQGHVPDAVHKGAHLEPDELAALYARTRIILNDQMDDQRRTGIISNRTMDALAAGAQVISDGVAGAEALGLDGLHVLDTEADLAPLLDRLLAAPPDSFEQRMLRHRELAARFNFDRAARLIVDRAQELLRDGGDAVVRMPAVALPKKALTAAASAGPSCKVLICDLPGMGVRLARAGAPATLLVGGDDAALPETDKAGWFLAEDPLALSRLADQAGAEVTLLLTPGDMPATTPLDAVHPSLNCVAAIHRAESLWQAGQAEGQLRLVTVEDAPAPFQPALAQLMAEPSGPLHPVRALKDRCNAALMAGRPQDAAADFETARAMWRRSFARWPCAPQRGQVLMPDITMLRLLQGMPLFPTGRLARAPKALREAVRIPRSVAFWPHLDRSLGVFLHLFYDELAPVFAHHLAETLRVPYRVYVSTDTDEKAARIATHLPEAEIRVFPNRGRDVWPRFWGFRDAHDSHDLVLHLHGKRSAHSAGLEDWFRHNLDALLGDRASVKAILTIFDQAPEVGVVAPPVYPGVMASAHWTVNRAMAQLVADRMGIIDLPGNDALVFPVGSMFWARSAALRPLLDLDLRQNDFAPEARQLDGTLAHAVERLVTISARHAGFDQISYSGQAKPGQNRHHHCFDDVAALRDYLRRRDKKRAP